MPELNSIALDLARPMSKLVPPAEVNTVPLELCSVSTNLNVLYTSVSPDTNPTSGKFDNSVILTNGSCSNLVTLPLAVSNSLALSISTKVVPCFSISYPLTYALPCESPKASFASEAVLPSLEVAPVSYIPRFVPDIKCSLISKSKALTA